MACAVCLTVKLVDIHNKSIVIYRNDNTDIIPKSIETLEIHLYHVSNYMLSFDGRDLSENREKSK